MKTDRFSGVLVPVLTPFHRDYEPDQQTFLSFCRSLLDQGAHGLAVFGTTSEANSLSLKERRTLLGALIEDGFDPKLLMPGTGASAIPEAVELTHAAVEAGAGGVLMLPPFYYTKMASLPTTPRSSSVWAMRGCASISTISRISQAFRSRLRWLAVSSTAMAQQLPASRTAQEIGRIRSLC